MLPSKEPKVDLFLRFVAIGIAALAMLGARAEEIKPGVLRTPDERFLNLPDYDFQPNYVEIGGYRVHYLDEGPSKGQPILLLHGEPSWCYLYRKMIPVLNKAGYRTIAPDLIGFGRSDKPAKREDYSYQMQVDTVAELVKILDLKDITLVCQDWGGLVGLRVAAENEERFARIVAANTGLPAGPGEDGLVIGGQFTEPDPNATLNKGDGFATWLRFSQVVPKFDAGYIVQYGTTADIPPVVQEAYNAPFPDETYAAGARVMPTLVMSQNATNRKTWEEFERWEKPFLTAFSDGDPISDGGYRVFQSRIPGAKDQPHTIIRGGGHFLQEDKGEELARVVVEFIRRTP